MIGQVGSVSYRPRGGRESKPGFRFDKPRKARPIDQSQPDVNVFLWKWEVAQRNEREAAEQLHRAFMPHDAELCNLCGGGNR